MFCHVRICLILLHEKYHNWHHYKGGVGHHPYGGHVYNAPTTFGLGKRSADADPEAEPEADADPHFYGLGLYGLGVAGHPGYATSYVAR